MRILHANKYYFLKGGAERYLFSLSALEREHGHDTLPFAMQDERNEPSEWARFFVSKVETERVRFDWQGARTAARMLYSFEARRKFARLIDVARPDVVHCHNIYHQISPSILGAAKSAGLPVVLTAHDYKLIAPNYLLFHDGEVCERTKPDRYWEALKHRCVKGSAAASALAAFEMSLHRTLGLWRRGVDRIIAPSRFLQTMLVNYDIPAEKIAYVPHFIDTREWVPSEGGDYALFVGRLSAEKGADVLVRAASLRPEIRVRIVGGGPQEQELRALAAKLHADNVTFAGPKYGEHLLAEYAGARFVVSPSVCYEVAGLAPLEAYAAGKPVIASRIGGLQEMVNESQTGYTFRPGDDAELSEQMARLWHSPVMANRMGAAGRMWVETSFTPQKHYDGVMAAYAQAKKDNR